MKLLLSLLGFFWAYTSIAQSDNPFLSIWNETKPVQQVVTIHREPLVATAPPELVTFAYLADPVDSLVAKRSMFTTAIYKDTVRLSTAAVRSLYQSNPKAIQKLRWGNILKPIGPLMIVSGIAIAYIGIRGEQKMDYIRGIGTKAQPNVPDVLVDYTKRSLPQNAARPGTFHWRVLCNRTVKRINCHVG